MGHAAKQKHEGKGARHGCRTTSLQAASAARVGGSWMVDEDDDGETCEPCYRRALANGYGVLPKRQHIIREKKALKTKENGPKTLKKVQKRLVVLKAGKREKTGKKQALQPFWSHSHIVQ